MERSVSVILGDLCFLAAVVLCFKSMSRDGKGSEESLFFCLIELLLD